MSRILTPANQLTFARLLLVPVFVICMLYKMPGWALIVFAVAGVTDLFDGLVARLSGESTELGAWLDPAADKLLVLSMFVMLTIPSAAMANRLPVWFTVLVISRDVGIILTVAIVNLAVGPRTFLPSLLGKAATAIFMVTGVATLYFNYRGTTSQTVSWLIYLSLFITAASGIDYIRRARAL